MAHKWLALAISTAFFFGWLGVLYAGADHPPPPGFLLIVLIDLLAAAALYWRVPTYMGWSKAGKRNRWLRALFEGLAAGLLVACVMLLVPLGGEPGIRPVLTDILIWCAVLGAIGAANGILVYGLSAYSSRKTRG